MDKSEISRVREILATVKPLAAEYYRLTGKPLGVTGEVAEYVAAEILGLQLVPARTVGYDALRGEERIQIKGRAYGENASKSQRISKIKQGAPCDVVLLVLLDNATLEAREMLEAPYADVCECLAKPGSKARERGALGVPRSSLRSTIRSIRRPSGPPVDRPTPLTADQWVLDQLRSCPSSRSFWNRFTQADFSTDSPEQAFAGTCPR